MLRLRDERTLFIAESDKSFFPVTKLTGAQSRTWYSGTAVLSCTFLKFGDAIVSGVSQSQVAVSCLRLQKCRQLRLIQERLKKLIMSGENVSLRNSVWFWNGDCYHPKCDFVTEYLVVRLVAARCSCRVNIPCRAIGNAWLSHYM